jgi:hypothetical protein
VLTVLDQSGRFAVVTGAGSGPGRPTALKLARHGRWGGSKPASSSNGAKLGINVEIVERNPANTGFVPERIRWVIG